MMGAAAWDCSECTFENAPSFSSCQPYRVSRAVPAAHPGQSFADSSRSCMPGQPKHAHSSPDGTLVVDTTMRRLPTRLAPCQLRHCLCAQVSTSSTANAQGWSDTLQGLVEGVVVRCRLDSAWEDVLRDAMLAGWHDNRAAVCGRPAAHCGFGLRCGRAACASWHSGLHSGRALATCVGCDYVTPGTRPVVERCRR